MKNYPDKICKPCGEKWGNKPCSDNNWSDWLSIGPCGICNAIASRVPTRFFGHLRGINSTKWPDNWPRYGRGCTCDECCCDMRVGPCKCGKWHKEGEFRIEFDKVVYRPSEEE